MMTHLNGYLAVSRRGDRAEREVAALWAIILVGAEPAAAQSPPETIEAVDAEATLPDFETPSELRAHAPAVEPVTPPAAAATEQQTASPPATAAAWASSATAAKPWRVLADLRGFYHYTSGKARPDWRGGELLSYFSAGESMSGAFIFRNEVRDSIGRYGSWMLIPKVMEDTWLVTSVGLGNGADFLPLARLDVQYRGLFGPPFKGVMYDVGVTSVWWTYERQQLAESVAVILWLSPFVIELRETLFLTDPGFGDRRVNLHGTAVVLWGEEGRYWFTARLNVGDEPENAPARVVARTPDLLAVSLDVGWRQWIDADYGVAFEASFYQQVDTWSRAGFVASGFFDF